MASPAMEHGIEQACERLFQCAGVARTRPGQPSHWPGPSSSFARASVASICVRSGGRRQDKAARRKGLGCACNAAAHGLAAHLPSRPRQQRGAGEGQHSGRPLSLLAKWLRNQFTKLLFRPLRPCLQPHTRPGRKADLHFGKFHTGGTPGKERAACADAEISILMQHNAENK